MSIPKRLDWNLLSLLFTVRIILTPLFVAAAIALTQIRSANAQRNQLPSDIAEEREAAEQGKKVRAALRMQQYYEEAFAIRSAPIIAQCNARMRQVELAAREGKYDQEAINFLWAQIKADYEAGLQVADAQARQDARQRVEAARTVEAIESIAGIIQ